MDKKVTKVPPSQYVFPKKKSGGGGKKLITRRSFLARSSRLVSTRLTEYRVTKKKRGGGKISGES